MASTVVGRLLVARASCLACAWGASGAHVVFRGNRWSRNWGIGGADCGNDGWSVGREFSGERRRMRVSGGSRAPEPIAAASRRAPAAAVKEKVVDEENEEEEEDAEEEEDEAEKGKIGRNASKKQSARAREWGRELATLSQSQLRQACKWASLDEDVYDAVMLVKNLGTSHKVKHGRRRQYNYIGGLLRDADPEIMESVLKATKDGDVEGLVFIPSNQPDDSDDGFEEEFEDEEAKVEDDGALQEAESWLQGLLAGDRGVEDEVYSIYDVDFDRQELRKLVREVRKLEVKSTATPGPEEVEEGQQLPEVEISALQSKRERAQKTLLHFLMRIVKERRDNAYDSAVL